MTNIKLTDEPSSTPEPVAGSATPEPTRADAARPSRWTSRKFLLSVSAQLTAVVVLMWPGHESAIVEASRSITSLLVLGLSVLGYVGAEASLDRQRTTATPREPHQAAGEQMS